MAEIYLLTPPKIDDDFADVLARTLDAGRVSALQLRLKEHSDAEIEALAPKLIEIAHQRGVSVILNDDAALAAKLGCDGVHIGQEDGSIRDARAVLGPKAIVGVTCHDSRHLAMTAGEQGADYVAFGAFFDTATKSPKTRADLDILVWWTELFELPCVAIGGVNAENASELIAAGADYIAVCGGVWSHPDGPEAACAGLSQLLD
ncbi:MAG: thiamine phosphate synthase [Oceanicaulis sp.]|uniref:thiamine phosphate synthase n=1 Tax=Oceanicaulis sp. UBA2681 TaxID=1947007 RepID=UPI000C0A1AA5|nr:thiamine phosphate synthase [Oceanicaulis sp. UBA2681]MAP48303.1 thiamine phosphate synthase [Oceanicaulis sp.]HCR66778.1 thiamine phosphate synthase [Oceanicaulis sp.]|tara:strand:+ start:784 stop:1395 length:612 start_codon:yes stop_codon:yes gene_type:complete